MVPSTAKEARRLGLPRYFTGQPCAHGHVAERSTASRACVECLAVLSAKCRERNLQRFLAKEAARRERRRGAILEYSRRRYAENTEAARAASKKWREKNRPHIAAKTARRKALKLQASPPWVDHEAIRAFYRQAKEITAATGIPHEVDHIHPLKGEHVCGLHVPWNLQILTKSDNSRKKNHMIDSALQGKGGK